MSHQLWGEFKEEEDESDRVVQVAAKRMKLDEMQMHRPVPVDKNITVEIKSSLVTQTIEVMKQTEMLQSLIDTYSNKSGNSNYLLNPCQMIPEVDFPPENAAEFCNVEKHHRPLWCMPKQETRFTQGFPRCYPRLDADICRAALRKAVCGQLRVAGFTDTAESALVLLSDAVEEFIYNFIQRIREVHENVPSQERYAEIDLLTLERAYYSLSNRSLLQVHNYFKHHVIARNRAEIDEFKNALQDYDKLMKESQSMQREDYQQQPDGSYVKVVEVPQQASSEGATYSGHVTTTTTTTSTLQEMLAASGNTLTSVESHPQHDHGGVTVYRDVNEHGGPIYTTQPSPGTSGGHTQQRN